MNLENIVKAKQELIAFEKEIKSLYEKGKIRAPIHLSGEGEESLIKIFQGIKKEDWVFSTYRSHYHALLKGIPPQWLKNEILSGNSMHIMNNRHKFYTTSIVGAHLPIALGVALALKKKNSKNKVWAFCGDMAAETGVFDEVSRYAKGHNLPLNLVIEDNGLGVYTPTQKVWGIEECRRYVNSRKNIGSLEYFFYTANSPSSNIIRYQYKRRWPHHGIGLWVDFSRGKKQGPSSYTEELKKAMTLLGEHEKTFFVGQTVGYEGSGMYKTLEDVPKDKRLELPVIEEVQMGMSTGLALEGFIPVSIYPRFDFLILATNQMVNHLDKTKELSNGRFNPKVIIRTAVGSDTPLHPGAQHCQDHTESYAKMLTNIDVLKLTDRKDIVPAYKRALESDRSTLLIEVANLYNIS